MPTSSSAQVGLAVTTACAGFANADVSQESAALAKCVLLCEQVIQELILEVERRVANAPLPSQVSSVKAWKSRVDEGFQVVSARSFDGTSLWDVPRSQRLSNAPPALTSLGFAVSPIVKVHEGGADLLPFHSTEKWTTPCGKASLPPTIDTAIPDETKKVEAGLLFSPSSVLDATSQGPVAKGSAFITRPPCITAVTRSMGLLLLTLHKKLDLREDGVVIFLAAMVYLVRLSARSAPDCVCVTNSNWYRLTVVSVLTATKMYNEGGQPMHLNHVFEKVTCIPLAELRILELDFLYLVDFDLVVDEENIKGWVEWIAVESPTLLQYLQDDAHSLKQDIIRNPLLLARQQEKCAGASYIIGDIGAKSEAGVSYDRSALSMLSNNLSNSFEYANESSLVVDVPLSFISTPCVRSAKSYGWVSGDDVHISEQEPQETRAVPGRMNLTRFAPLSMLTVAAEKQQRLFNAVHAPCEPVSPLTLRELSRLAEKRDVSPTPPPLMPDSPVGFFKRSSILSQRQHLPKQPSSLLSQHKISQCGSKQPFASSLQQPRDVAMQRACFLGQGDPLVSTTQLAPQFHQERLPKAFEKIPLGGMDRKSLNVKQFESRVTTEKEVSPKAHPANERGGMPRSALEKELLEPPTRQALISSWKDRHILVKQARQIFSVFSSLVSGKLDIMDDRKASSSGPNMVDRHTLLHDDDYDAAGDLSDAVARPLTPFVASSFPLKSENFPDDEPTSKEMAATSGPAAHAPPPKSALTSCGAFTESHDTACAGTIRAKSTARDKSQPSVIVSEASAPRLSFHKLGMPQQGSSSHHPQEVQMNKRPDQGKGGYVEAADTYQLDEVYGQTELEDFSYEEEDEEGYYDEEYYDDDEYYDDEDEYWDEEDEEVEICRPPPRIHSPPLL